MLFFIKKKSKQFQKKNPIFLKKSMKVLFKLFKVEIPNDFSKIKNPLKIKFVILDNYHLFNKIYKSFPMLNNQNFSNFLNKEQFKKILNKTNIHPNLVDKQIQKQPLNKFNFNHFQNLRENRFFLFKKKSNSIQKASYSTYKNISYYKEIFSDPETFLLIFYIIVIIIILLLYLILLYREVKRLNGNNYLKSFYASLWIILFLVNALTTLILLLIFECKNLQIENNQDE